MKKFLIIIGIFLFQNIVFWDFNLVVENEKIGISENFQLKINIDEKNNSKSWNKKIEIVWIEKFDVLWQSHQSKFSNINWKITSLQVLILTLRPKEKWEFELWPVKILWSDEKIFSNKVKIFVDWEKNFLWNNWNFVKNKNLEKILKNDLKDEKIDFEKNNLLFQFISFLILFFWLLFFQRSNLINFFKKNK